MSEFKREDRFIVLKRKDLEALNHFQKAALAVALEKIQNHLPARQYVVVESDWPEYEFVWEMIQARVEGKPNRITALEADNAKLRAVAEAAVCWWEMHRPKDFSAAQHLQNPRINTIRGSSGHLATVVAQYLSAAGYGHTEGEG